MNRPFTHTTKSHFTKRRLLVSVIALCVSPFTQAVTIDVNTAEDLQNALKNAYPGDEIVIAPGTYVGNKSQSGDTVAHFYINRSGEPYEKITLRSADTSQKAILSGSNANSGYVLYLENADNWIIKDIKITKAQKGIMLDGSNNNIIDNIQVYNTGAEATHFRKNSSNNTLINCHIFETGTRVGKEGLGEGVYIGTHNGHEISPKDNSNNNLIGGCHIGPNVRAEAFDVKAGTQGTIIEYNYINGKGIIGANGSPAADSFIDVKGDKVIIRNNTMEHKGDSKVHTAIMTFQEHQTSNIYDNFYDLAPGKSFLKLLDGQTHLANNTPLSADIKLVEKSHMDNGDEFDYNLDYSIEKDNQGPYPCFDELTGACGGEAPANSSSSSSSGNSSSSSTNNNNSSSSSNSNGGSNNSSSSMSSNSSSTSSGGNCVIVNGRDKTEVNLNGASCITFSAGLSGKTFAVWDSDTNKSCDWRGRIVPQTGGTALSVNKNYHAISGWTGTTVNMVGNNNCQFVKVRAY